MIYLVSACQKLFESTEYKQLSIEDSLAMINSWGIIQCDSETSGRNCHLCEILCFQFGDCQTDTQVVVDCTTVDILLYKNILENRYLIFQNAKFDLQFLYCKGIIPRKIYDTMIVEQLLHLGYPAGVMSYSLAAIAKRRLNIDIDKSIRGEIIWRGLDESVIVYASNDVRWLYQIMQSQIEECKNKECLIGAKLECDAVPAIAYLEWCGIKLDEDKWKAKMDKDKANLDKARKDLDSWFISLCDSADKNPQGYDVVTLYYTPYNDEEYNSFLQRRTALLNAGYVEIATSTASGMGSASCTLRSPTAVSLIPRLKEKYLYTELQGDLFGGYSIGPECKVNWSSSRQVVDIAKALGFDTTVQDKKTGEDKDSVIEKHLKGQKGINDEFLKLYFDYQEHAKVVSSFGQGHLDAINPKTGRIHTVYRQLGAASGRMSCGTQQPDTDLAKFKKLPPKRCTLPNIQQLPHDKETRSCFVSEEDNLFCSCDYSAQEGRVQGDIYQDEAILKMYREGIDGHSMYAKIFFKEELKDIDVHDVQKLRPDLRTKAKAPEFALAYGAGYTTIMQALKCTEEEALQIVKNYEEGFKGTIEFARKGSAFVRKNGYILMCPLTGHKMYWWDHKEWLERQQSFTPEFWEEYRSKHKGTGDRIAQTVSMHFRAASKYDRLARNAPPQGTSAIMTKEAVTNLFNWIVDNNYFGIVKIVALVHDEVNIEYPKSMPNTSVILQNFMETAAAKYCKSLPIPAEASVSNHWVH